MRIRLVVPLLLLAACAHNPYAAHYTPQYYRPKPAAVIQTDTLGIWTSPMTRLEMWILLDHGYANLGSSVFDAPVSTATEAQLLEHAAKVGATLVLTRADTTDLNAHYTAMYFVRYRDPLGLYLLQANQATATRLNAPGAVVAVHVAPGSPADRAGIQGGDILLEMGGAPLPYGADFYALTGQQRGKQIDVLLDRNGERLRKTVEVLP